MKRFTATALALCAFIAAPAVAQQAQSANVTLDVPVSIKSFAYAGDRSPQVSVACAASDGQAASIVARLTSSAGGSMGSAAVPKLASPDEAVGVVAVPLTAGVGPPGGTVLDPRTGKSSPAKYYAYEGTISVPLMYYPGGSGGASGRASGGGFDPKKSRSWSCVLIIDGLSADAYNNSGAKWNTHYFEDGSLKATVSGFFN